MGALRDYVVLADTREAHASEQWRHDSAPPPRPRRKGKLGKALRAFRYGVIWGIVTAVLLGTVASLVVLPMLLVRGC